jgi:hypothetical protein
MPDLKAVCQRKPKMRVHYTTTMADYVAFNRYFLNRNTKLRTLLVMSTVGAALLVAALLVFTSPVHDRSITLVRVGVSVVIALASCPLWAPRILDYVVRLVAQQNGTRGVVGPITLELRDECLVEITETTRSEVRWENIQRMDEWGDYTFIWITGLSAAMVPRHGFEHAADYELLKSFARAKLEATEGRSKVT